jgi:2'-5' RNA ligase
VPRVRLGVALLLSDPWRSEVDGLRRALGSPTLHTIPPHVTLVPPVNVRVDNLPDAFDLVRRVASSSAPVTTTLGPVSTFAPLTPVIKLDVGNTKDIRAIRDRVNSGVLHKESQWPFEPHVTLHDDASEELISGAQATMQDFAASTTFESVAVLRQDDDRVWRPVFDARFEPAVVVGAGGLALELFEHTRLDPASSDALGLAHDPVGFVLTACMDGKPVAALTADLQPAFALKGLRVDVDHRGLGIGSHLLRRARFRAEQMGFAEILDRTGCADVAGLFRRFPPRLCAE